jgi:hypothetical protein
VNKKKYYWIMYCKDVLVFNLALSYACVWGVEEVKLHAIFISVVLGRYKKVVKTKPILVIGRGSS